MELLVSAQQQRSDLGQKVGHGAQSGVWHHALFLVPFLFLIVLSIAFLTNSFAMPETTGHTDS